jgi:hypothetical protein
MRAGQFLERALQCIGSSAKRVGNILPRGTRRPLFFKETDTFRTVRKHVSPSRIAGRTRVVVVAVREIHQQQHRSPQIHCVPREPDRNRLPRNQHPDVEEPQNLPTRFAEEPMYLNTRRDRRCHAISSDFSPDSTRPARTPLRLSDDGILSDKSVEPGSGAVGAGFQPALSPLFLPRQARRADWKPAPASASCMCQPEPNPRGDPRAPGL